MSSKAFPVVLGGRLKLKGDKPKKSSKKRLEREPNGDDGDDDDLDLQALSAAAAAGPIPGKGSLTTSGVVVMGVDTDFSAEVKVGDSLLVTVSDRFRNMSTDESRVVNMVLGRSSLNIEAPFSCDVTAPTAFLVQARAPDVEALKAARREERKRQRQAEEDESTVTYKVVKQGSGTWKTWQTVTEKVSAGTSREDMLRRRASEKADRHCK
jgi:hypothetical protein